MVTKEQIDVNNKEMNNKELEEEINKQNNNVKDNSELLNENSNNSKEVSEAKEVNVIDNSNEYNDKEVKESNELNSEESNSEESDLKGNSEDPILSADDLENVSDPSQIEQVNESSVSDDLGWQPKTEIGRKVKSGEITNIDEILDHGYPILETEIVDKLLPNLKTEILFIGQAKGKFGGGQRRPVRQTQKKTEEGNKPRFTIIAAVGNEDGYVGIGVGKAKETVPAREKAIRKAKLNIIKIRRGCGSWECNCGNPHSIPLAIEGKTGSVRIKLLPAPKGKGLIIEEELKKIMRLAGIRDLWSVTKGQTGTKFNLIFACFDALNNLNKFKIKSNFGKIVGLTEGSIVNKEIEE